MTSTSLSGFAAYYCITGYAGYTRQYETPGTTLTLHRSGSNPCSRASLQRLDHKIMPPCGAASPKDIRWPCVSNNAFSRRSITKTSDGRACRITTPSRGAASQKHPMAVRIAKGKNITPSHEHVAARELFASDSCASEKKRPSE